ncbi:hypothetical protein HYQ44_006135 [Verticillium longisporum]|nr:hypothetical protein HYQ44_006135 [Verticillium longisporum]
MASLSLLPEQSFLHEHNGKMGHPESSTVFNKCMRMIIPQPSANRNLGIMRDAVPPPEAARRHHPTH